MRARPVCVCVSHVESLHFFFETQKCDRLYFSILLSDKLFQPIVVVKVVDGVKGTHTSHKIRFRIMSEGQKRISSRSNIIDAFIFWHLTFICIDPKRQWTKDQNKEKKNGIPYEWWSTLRDRHRTSVPYLACFDHISERRWSVSLSASNRRNMPENEIEHFGWFAVCTSWANTHSLTHTNIDLINQMQADRTENCSVGTHYTFNL